MSAKELLGLNKNPEHPILEIWGVAGASRSGKTSFSRKMLERHGDLVWCVISSDKFWKVHKPICAAGPKDKFPNWETPEVVDVEALVSFIQTTVNKFEEAFKDKGPMRKVLLIEGFLLFSLPSLIHIFDRKLYFTIKKFTCFSRRMQTTPVPASYFEFLLWPEMVAHNQHITELPGIVILNGDDPAEEIFELGARHLIHNDPTVPSCPEILVQNLKVNPDLDLAYAYYEKKGAVINEQIFIRLSQK